MRSKAKNELLSLGDSLGDRAREVRDLEDILSKVARSNEDEIRQIEHYFGKKTAELGIPQVGAAVRELLQRLGCSLAHEAQDKQIALVKAMMPKVGSEKE